MVNRAKQGRCKPLARRKILDSWYGDMLWGQSLTALKILLRLRPLGRRRLTAPHVTIISNIAVPSHIVAFTPPSPLYPISRHRRFIRHRRPTPHHSFTRHRHFIQRYCFTTYRDIAALSHTAISSGIAVASRIAVSSHIAASPFYPTSPFYLTPSF